MIEIKNKIIMIFLKKDFSLIKRIDVPKNLSEYFSQVDIFDKNDNYEL